MRYKGINNLRFVVVKNLNLVSLLYQRAIGLAVICAILLNFIPLTSNLAYAAPNYQINYQGKLNDSAGDAVTDGDYDITFKLYTASSGGTAIWTEAHTGAADDIAVTDGLFSVMLGSLTSLSTVNFNQTLYLGVTVESDSEMTPRKILGAVPAAFEADKLDGLTSADFISTSTTALPNVWSASGLGSVGSSTATTTFLGNLAAAGSSIFNGILTVFDRVTSPYFVATSTSVASQFPYASTTMISATTASTTNLIISGLGSGLTKVTNGVVSLATAGTDYLTSAFQNWQISGGYLTPTTTQTVLLNGGFVSSGSSTVSGLLKTDYASTTALTVTGSGHSFNITNSNATSTIVGDVNIAGSTGVTIWTNDGNSNVAQGSLNIGSATPQNGFAVTRLGGSDTTFARFTEAGGALAQFVDGTGIQLDFRDTGVISRIRFDSNGDNYISPASGNVYFSPAAGNVGIGTSTPQADLNIGNNIAIESASAGSSVPTRSTLGGALLGIGLLDTGPYIQSFASQPLLLNPGGNNVGIGTTTPGTLFSLGNTGASTINITPSGTSTFGLGLNLRGGCYAINDTCIGGSATLSGGTAGMLAAWTSSSALTATGTPNFDAFNATSTTATSTIAGGLAIETSGFVYDYSTNRVGIGTASPGVPLEVVGNIRTTGDGVGLIVADTSLNYSSNLVYSSSLLGLSNISRIRLGGNTGTSAFAISNFDAAINFIVNRTGNVGVGTTSPYARLSVAGETVAERFTATSTTLASTFPYASTTALTVSGAGNLNIDTTNTSPFTISSTLPRIILTDSTAGDDDFTISPNSDYIEFLSGSLRDILVINGETRTSGAGFIGIGTTTPGAQLAASTTAGIGLMVDQRGTDDIFRLLDGGSTVLEVPDGGNLYLANGDFLGWRNASGAVRTIMSHDSSNNVNIKTSDSTVLRFLSSTGVFELARINQSNYASFGIGTTTPGAMLSASSSAGAIGLMIDQQGTGDIARFLDAGSPALIIRDGGNVGIGTTSPDYLLTIGNTASAANNKIAIDAAAARQSSISFRSAGVDKWFIGRGDSDVLSDSSFFIGNTSGGTNNDPGGASAKLTINSSGLVGIGTSTAATTEGLLHVADNSTGAVNSVVSNTNSGTGAFATFQLRNGGSLAESLRLGVLGTGFTTSGGFIQDAGFLAAETNLSGGLSIMTRAAAPIAFYTNGSTNERMRIGSDGNVGVATTTAVWPLTSFSASGPQLALSHGGGFAQWTFRNSSGTLYFATTTLAGTATSSPAAFELSGTTGALTTKGDLTLGAGSGNPGIQLQEAGTMRWTVYNDNTNDRFYITDDDGDNGVYIAQDATSWTANSDIRLKENIVPIESALEKILSLTGYTYNFKGTQRKEIGLIAQEVEPLFPELVDTNGQYLGLTYDRIGPILVQAIKEQQEQIDSISSLNSTSTAVWSIDEDTGQVKALVTFDLNNQDLINVKSIASASGNWSIAEDGTLTVKKVQTDELCVGTVCVNEERLRDLLENAGIEVEESGGDVEGGGDNNGNASSTPPTEEGGDNGGGGGGGGGEETPTPESEPTDGETPPTEPEPEPTPEPEPELESPSGDEIPTDNGGTPAEEPPAEAPPAE